MKKLIFGLLLLFPQSFTADHNLRLIIWNVGQGQWITFSDPHVCLHIDVGGEFADFQSVKKECADKINKVAITHADWDHISFLKVLATSSFQACRMEASALHDFENSRSKALFENLPLCEKSGRVKVLQMTASDLKSVSRKKNFTRNDLSQIWNFDGKVLIPGDSTRPAEKLWAKNFSGQNKLSFLIVGHHGSDTSTSDELLKHLKYLEMAFVSARRKVYGHPHPRVMLRLKRAQVPMLTTETWGHIRVEL